MGTIKAITNIRIYGLDFYYDDVHKKVGFPTFYNEKTHSLDYRVGHQQWIDESEAKAIVLRIIELRPLTNQEVHEE